MSEINKKVEEKVVPTILKEEDGTQGVVQEQSTKVAEVIDENAQIMISIEGEEYPINTKSLSIRGQITPEVEKELLKFPDLTELFLHTSTYVPEGLTNLTKLYANYALVIPATLINLVELYANSVTELPDTFVKLERIHAQSLLNIPDIYRHLKNKSYNVLGTKAD